jgi:hypothetical protein
MSMTFSLSGTGGQPERAGPDFLLRGAFPPLKLYHTCTPVQHIMHGLSRAILITDYVIVSELLFRVVD